MSKKRIWQITKTVALLLIIVFTGVDLHTFANLGSLGNGQGSNNSNGKSSGYLVSFKDNKAKEKIKKDKNKGKKVTDDFDTQNVLAMDITSEEANELMMSGDVLLVEEDGFVEILSIGEPDKNNIKVDSTAKSRINRCAEPSKMI